MVGHGGSSAGSYLADPTSPIPSHCASIVVTSTLRGNIEGGRLLEVLLFVHKMQLSIADWVWVTNDAVQWCRFSAKVFGIMNSTTLPESLQITKSGTQRLNLLFPTWVQFLAEENLLALKVLNFWKLTSYCSLKPLWSGMGEVVPARASPTLHPPFPPTVHQLSWLAL